MFSSTNSRQVILDRFHSNLLDRMALRDGLIPKEKWHGLPIFDDFDQIPKNYVQIVEDNFASFTSMEQWHSDADKLLTLLSLYKNVSTSNRHFEWCNSDLVANKSVDIPSDMLISASDWAGVTELALHSIKQNGLVEIAKAILSDPIYNFERFGEKPAGSSEFDQNMQSAYKPSTIYYFLKPLAQFIHTFLKQLYEETTPGNLPDPYFSAFEFDGYFESHYQKDGVAIHVRESIKSYIEVLVHHINGLVVTQLLHSDDVICTSLYSSHPSRTPFLNDDVIVLLKANFSEHIEYLPAPRTIEEAIELRDKPEVSRLSELIERWTSAAESGDFSLEKRIARDIEKAQRELKYLDRVKSYSNSELGIWIKVFGGQIPIFSNILSAAEGLLHLADKLVRRRNVWVSTNSDISSS